MQIRGLTRLVVLCPVQIPTKVVQGIMMMPIILLLRATCCLILLCPTGFNHLAIRLARVLDILESPQDLTEYQVPTNMGTRNRSTDAGNDCCHGRKSFSETIEQVDRVLTPNIIAKHNPAVRGTLSKSKGKSIIGVGKSSNGISTNRKDSRVSTYASPFFKSTIPCGM